MIRTLLLAPFLWVGLLCQGVMAQSPEKAIFDAVALCQNWIDTGQKIDQSDGWALLVTGGRHGVMSIFVNQQFQIFLDTFEEIRPFPRGSDTEKVPVRLCKIEPTSEKNIDTENTPPESLPLLRRAQELLDGVDGIDHFTSKKAFQQLILNYKNHSEYVIKNDSVDTVNSDSFHVTFSRCLTDAIEYINIDFVSGTVNRPDLSNVTLNKINTPPGPEYLEYLEKCWQG